MHPSFEDRPGAPDRVFANVDDATYEHLVDAWERAPRATPGAADADVLHLNHLTPINEAAARAFPDMPVDRAPARHRAADAARDRRRARPGLGPRRGVGRADAPLGAPLRAAASCSRPTRCGACPTCCGVDPARVGVGAERVRPGALRPAARCRGDERLALWRRWLVDEPRGWDRVAACRGASPTTRTISRRSATPGRCCSTSAATPRSSGSRS